MYSCGLCGERFNTGLSLRFHRHRHRRAAPYLRQFHPVATQKIYVTCQDNTRTVDIPEYTINSPPATSTPTKKEHGTQTILLGKHCPELRPAPVLRIAVPHHIVINNEGGWDYTESEPVSRRQDSTEVQPAPDFSELTSLELLDQPSLFSIDLSDLPDLSFSNDQVVEPEVINIENNEIFPIDVPIIEPTGTDEADAIDVFEPTGTDEVDVLEGLLIDYTREP